MTVINLHAEVAAPPELVWDLLVDVESWPAWSAFDDVSVVELKDEFVVRRLAIGDAVVFDVARIADEGRRLSCRHLAGLPLRHYVTEISLDATATGAVVDWNVRVEPSDGSDKTTEMLTQLIEESVDGLAFAAELRGLLGTRNGRGREDAPDDPPCDSAA